MVAVARWAGIEVGLLDFVALNIYPRPEPGQAKVTVRNINCTNQFPMNDQVGMTMS